VAVTVAVTVAVFGVEDESVTVMVQVTGRLGAWKVAVWGAAPDPLPTTHIPPHWFVFQRYGFVPPDTVSCWEPLTPTENDAGEAARPPLDPPPPDPPLVTVTVVDAVAEPASFVAVNVYEVVSDGVMTTELPVTVPMPWSMVIEVAPVTVHESVESPPGATTAGEALNAEMLGGRAVVLGAGFTVMVAVSVMLSSATLAATTWYVPATWGAV
jgi:hypothetical protein